MTTAARPTWAPAKGGNEQGGTRIFGPSQKYSSRDIASHTTLKPRKDGQDTQDELKRRNLRDELDERERRHFSSKNKFYNDDRDHGKGSHLFLEGSKRDFEDHIVPRSVDADDSDVEVNSDDESDDDDEDDTEALLAELEQIKKERAEEKLRKGSQRLPGMVNWGTTTVIAMFAGMLYGGSREASSSVSKDAEVMLKLGSTEDKRAQYRLMRDAMEKRFIRVTRGALVGGVRLGMFTAAFYNIQNLLAEKRGVHDVFNVVGAGSATASAFGLIMPGSFRWRARNMALGSVLGAAFCFPLGWIHLKMVEIANEENSEAHSDQREVKSGVSAAIERLEGNLRK